MTLIEVSLNSWLETDTAIQARVNGKIFPSGGVEQGNTTAEYMTYRKIGGENEQHQAAAGALASTVFLVTAYSDSAKKAAEIMELVRLRCDGYRGVIGTTGIENTVRRMSLRAARADVEPPLPAQQPDKYSESKELSIWHVVTEPSFS